MGVIELKEGLSPEQFLRSRIHSYYFLGFVVLCAVVVILVAISVYASLHGSPKPMAHLRVNVVGRGTPHGYIEDVIVTVKGDDEKNRDRTYSELSGGLTVYEVPYGNYKIQIDGNGQTVTQQMTISSAWAETTIQFPNAPQSVVGKPIQEMKGAASPQLSATENRLTRAKPPAPAQQAALRETLPSAPEQPSPGGESMTVTDNQFRASPLRSSSAPPLAMFDVKQLDAGCFDNNTAVGMEILKADKVGRIATRNNVAYSDPTARSAPYAGIDRSYNYSDWLDFLDRFDDIVVYGKSPAEHIGKLRTRLESEWGSMSADQRDKRRQELESLANRLATATPKTYWSVTEPLRHAENVPPFVRLPCH